MALTVNVKKSFSIKEVSNVIRSALAFDERIAKMTTITLFELYFGAKRSVKQEDGISDINSLLNSIDLLAFDEPAAWKAGEI